MQKKLASRPRRSRTMFATQPGFLSTPIIVLDGSLALPIVPGGLVDGLTITGGDTLIKGLVISGFRRDGLVLGGQGGNSGMGNFIGTDAAGDFDRRSR